MINRNISEVACNLLRATKGANVKLVAKPGTLIHALREANHPKTIAASLKGNDLKGNDRSHITDFELLRELVHSCSGSKWIEGDEGQPIISQHDALTENYTTDLAKLTGTHLDFAKNTVNKYCKDFVAQMETVLDEPETLAPLDCFNIRYVGLPTVLQTALFSEIEERGIDAKKSNVSPVLFDRGVVNEGNLPSPLEYCLTGDEFVDAEISQMFNELGTGPIISYLSNDYSNLYSIRVRTDRIRALLVCYLFWRAVYERQDFNVGEGRLQLGTRANINLSFFAGNILEEISYYRRDIRNGELVAYANAADFVYLGIEKKILLDVYDETFSRFAQEGGSIELLLGAIGSSQTSAVDGLTVSKVLAEKEAYVRKWTALSNLYLSTSGLSKLRRFKANVELAIGQISASVSKEVETLDNNVEYTFINDAYLLDRHRRLMAYVQNLTLADCGRLWEVALDLVAGIIFSYSNASRILRSITELQRAGVDMSLTDSAVLTVADYLTDFMLEQCVVIRE